MSARSLLIRSRPVHRFATRVMLNLEMERDLLAFENRIQANFRKNKKISSKYKIYFWSSILLLLYICFTIGFLDISATSRSWHIFIGILAIFILFLVASLGILGSRLSSSSTFTSRMNNSLKPFHLGIGSNGSLEFKKRIPTSLIHKFQEYKKNALESATKDS